MASKEAQLLEMISPVVESMDYIMWGLEYSAQGRHSTLRIYIDHDNGITVDDCAAVSRQISAVMDVEDPISQEYTLEVSSPGMDRPLFTLEQFQRYINEWVEIRLRMPFEGRRKFKGVLVNIEDQDVVVQVDNTEFLLPIDMIEKAHVIPQFKD